MTYNWAILLIFFCLFTFAKEIYTLSEQTRPLGCNMLFFEKNAILGYVFTIKRSLKIQNIEENIFWTINLLSFQFWDISETVSEIEILPLFSS